MISKEQEARIRQLFFGEHFKIGTIAQQLGIHRDVVVRVVNTDAFNKRGTTPKSAIDPYIPFIEQTLKTFPTLTASALHTMLRQRGYPGSAVQLRRRIRTEGWRQRFVEPFFELSTLPGEQGQVDWVHLGPIAVGSTTRPLYGLVVVLSHSRAFHMHLAFDMKVESVLRGHLEAFDHFGGVPRQLLYDNMKTAVLEREGTAVRFHPRLLAMCGHYAVRPIACAPRRANEKGKVERRIRDIRTAFLAGRTFTGIDDVRDQFDVWRRSVAYTRRHPDDHDRTVAEVFAEERGRLLALPEHPMASDELVTAVVGKQPYVHYDANRYSVAPTCVGRPVTVVASDRTVRVFAGQELVAEHARSYGRRERIEDPAHFAALAELKTKARALHGRSRLLAAVPSAQALYEALLARHIPLAPQTTKLLVLLDQYGAERLEAAMALALSHQTVGAESVARLLEASCQHETASPDRLHLPSRPDVDDLHITPHRLEDYDDLVDDTPDGTTGEARPTRPRR